MIITAETANEITNDDSSFDYAVFYCASKILSYLEERIINSASDGFKSIVWSYKNHSLAVKTNVIQQLRKQGFDVKTEIEEQIITIRW